MPTLSGDVATLLGGDYSPGDPVALWVESSMPFTVDGTTTEVGGRYRVTVAGDGTFSVAGLPTSVADVPLYRITIDARSLRAQNKKNGETTGWFPLTVDRNLTWVVANYVTAEVISAATATNIAAAAALGATTDSAVASFINNAASATRVAGDALYARKRALDPRTFGAVGDGTTDDTAALQACITAAGSGTVELPPLTFKVTAPLVVPTGCEIRGTGAKGSNLATSTDITVFSITGGEGQAIRNLKITSSFTGARTTYDIDVVNPTKPTIEGVEINLPNASTGAGGIRFTEDSGLAGNAFMPQLARVWIRNGRLVIDSVTDGHVVDAWVWANGTGATSAISLSNISDGWSFIGVDVVPPVGDAAGYLITSTNHTKIVGGYVDGSYDALLTGHGIKAVNAGRLFVTGTNLYACGRSGIYLQNSHGCSVGQVGFYRNNKADGGYPDIDLYSSTCNTFIGNSHSQPTSRTSKGAIYREDSGSNHNLFDSNALDTSLGNQYLTPLLSANADTQGPRNRPTSLFPRMGGAPDLIVPPAATISIPGATAWPAAQTAILHRFTVTTGATYRYANFRVDTGSGNMQASILKLSGSTFTDYTRVMDSGSIACTTGDKFLDMGSTYLSPGEYAFALWVDNTTATLRYATNSGLTAMRTTAEIASLAGGVPASGSGISWGSTRYVGGISLGFSV